MFKDPKVGAKGTDLGELKDVQKAAFAEACKPPTGRESPATAFEMLYYCRCYGQKDCNVKIKSKGCVTKNGIPEQCERQLEAALDDEVEKDEEKE